MLKTRVDSVVRAGSSVRPRRHQEASPRGAGRQPLLAAPALRGHRAAVDRCDAQRPKRGLGGSAGGVNIKQGPLHNMTIAWGKPRKDVLVFDLATMGKDTRNDQLLESPLNSASPPFF